MSTVIKVENLSKQYRLGDVGTGTLSHDLKRWWYQVRGKEDPYLRIGEANDRTRKGDSDYVWALKDINFEVKAGEVLGIIGRNGAGKSTLLKILSKTTKPTTGSIKVKGRIASLLEVGTGFHPELTGRENIYLNGAILGMTRREIQSKFDEIVDFSGVERYIDTPVKRYSSGMYVRLAFAVAAHLEPEILIVDEVLAVGDAEFQKKCLGKMRDVSTNGGRTVLFVSHNMAAITDLCMESVLLNQGSIELIATTKEVINLYVSNNEKKGLISAKYTVTDSDKKEYIYIDQSYLSTENDFVQNQFEINEKIFITIELVGKYVQNDILSIGIAITDVYDRRVIVDWLEDVQMPKNLKFKIKAEVPNFLTPGEYKIQIGVTSMRSNLLLDYNENNLRFTIVNENTRFEKIKYDYGVINKKFLWY